MPDRDSSAELRVRVPVAVRDRIEQLAAARGRTIPEELCHLLRLRLEVSARREAQRLWESD